MTVSMELVLDACANWHITVENNAPGVILRECQFPIFSVAEPQVPLEVMTSKYISERSDAAVFRCRATIGAAPLYEVYLGKANAFREKYRDLLLEGRFSALEYHTLSEPSVQRNSFLRGNRLAVVLTQNWKDEINTGVSTPGYRLTHCDSVEGNVKVNAKGEILLPRDSFAVLIYEKEQ